jgi:hypothetical protein
MKTQAICDPYLTAGYPAELTRMMKRSVPGMAHWAGSGPTGTICRGCIHYGYESVSRNARGEAIKPVSHRQGCRKFYELTGRPGGAIPETTESCRHFQRR